MNDKTISVRIKNGYLVASVCDDPDYPGIDIEFVADNDSGTENSSPRVLVESPIDSMELRALCWTDKENEDYTDEIMLYSFESDYPLDNSFADYVEEHKCNHPIDYLLALETNARRPLTREELYSWLVNRFGTTYTEKELYNLIDTEIEDREDR